MEKQRFAKWSQSETENRIDELFITVSSLYLFIVLFVYKFFCLRQDELLVQ